jgi:hypothetical protein
MLVVGVWIAHSHAQVHRKVLRAAIGQQLNLVLTELQKHEQGGCFPSAQAAYDALSDESVVKRINITSLFKVDDLYYNAARPVTGSVSLVVCAPVGDSFYGMRADTTLTLLSKTELDQEHLVPLVPAIATPVPKREH